MGCAAVTSNWPFDKTTTEYVSYLLLPLLTLLPTPLLHELQTALGNNNRHAFRAVCGRPSLFWSVGSVIHHGLLPHWLVMGVSSFSPPPTPGWSLRRLFSGRSPLYFMRGLRRTRTRSGKTHVRSVPLSTPPVVESVSIHVPYTRNGNLFPLLT